MNALLRVLGKMEGTLPEENYSDQPPFLLELVRPREANRHRQGIVAKGLHESLVRLEGRRGELMRLLGSLERHVESPIAVRDECKERVGEVEGKYKHRVY